MADNIPGQQAQEVDVASVVDPALARSADPASDLAAAALMKVFGGQPQPPAQPPAPQPTAQPPAQPPAPQPTAQPPAPPVQPPAPQPPVQPPAPPAPVSIADRYSAPDPNAQPVVPTLPEGPPEQDIRLPENTAENVGHAFAAVRAEVKKYKQMAEEFRRQVEQVRADYSTYAQRESAITEKLTAEQNRAKELEEKLGQLDLEQSPAFREKYDAPLNAVSAEIAKTLVANGYQPQQADDLARQVVLAKDVAAVSSLPGMAELPSTVQGMIMYKFNEADGLWAQRDQALAEWRSTREGLQQTATREDAVVSAQRRAELVGTGIDRVSKVAPDFIWNDPEFAEFRKTEVEKVKAWYGQAPEDQIAAAAVEGALVAPFAYRLVKGLMDKVMELQGALDAHHRIGNPRTVPYYRPPEVAAPPAPPPPPAGEQKSWTPVDTGTDPVAAASSLIADGALKKMFQQ